MNEETRSAVLKLAEDFGQTEVILEALCHAFGIPHPRPRKQKRQEADETR